MKLIVEMEMTENCFECNFHCVGQFCDGMGYCSAVPPYCDDDFRPCEEKRPSWCPIKGVLPEQHGDLIDGENYHYGYSQGMINAAPTVDAVPVTRCIDCKHSTKVDGMIGLVWCDHLAEGGTWIENDWFCADGERRTE